MAIPKPSNSPELDRDICVDIGTPRGASKAGPGGKLGPWERGRPPTGATHLKGTKILIVHIDRGLARSNAGGGAPCRRKMPASVVGGLIEDDGEADNLVVPDAEVAGHDQLVGQVRLVVGAVEAWLSR